MTKLKSFGCSFIFGSDLADISSVRNQRRQRASASKRTWPALLAASMNVSYRCFAHGGSGNLQILNEILTQVSTKEPCVFVIGWTWIDRLDYTHAKDNSWNTILPTDSDSTASFYYRNLHSQFRDKLTSLVYINTAINALQQHGHKFIMTCQDELIFENKWHCNQTIELLQKSVAPYITRFDNQTFLDWSKTHGYSISAAGHPLEDAHRAAFEYIRNQHLV